MDQTPLILILVLVLIVSVLLIPYSTRLSCEQGKKGEETVLIPGSPFHLPMVRGEIPVLINTSISTTRKELDQLAEMPDSERTSENTLLRLEEIMTCFDDATLSLLFIADECQDPYISDEAGKARDMRNKFLNDVYLRPDLAHALSVPTVSNASEVRLLKKYTKNFFSASLPPVTQKELTRLGEGLSALESRYQKNQDEGSNLKNLLLVPDIMHSREKIVRLLGYQAFAEYQIAQSGLSADLKELVSWLSEGSSPYIRLSHDEARTLLSIKQKTEPGATGVFDHEIPSLRVKMQELSSGCEGSESHDSYQIKDVLVRTNQFLSLFFSIDITPVQPVQGYSDSLYLYRLTDRSSGETRAWYYLGFRTHTQQAGRGRTYYLRSGHMSGGHWIPPVSAIILTVPDRSTAGDLVIQAADIQILFHELGHMLKHSLSLNPYATLSSGAYEGGAYTEVPSLVFERLITFPEVFRAVTGTTTAETQFYCGQQTQDYEDEWGIGYSRAYTFLLSLIDLDLSSGDYNLLDSYPYLYENITGYRTVSGGADLLEDPAFFIGNAGIYWHYALDELYADTIIRDISDGHRLHEDAGVTLQRKYFEQADYSDFLIPGQDTAEKLSKGVMPKKG